MFQDYFADLSESIGTATNFDRVIGRIYSQKLISQAIFDDITTTASDSAYQKARRLVRELQRQIDSSEKSDQEEMLLKICDVLLNFDDQKLKEIAVKIKSQFKGRYCTHIHVHSYPHKHISTLPHTVTHTHNSIQS